MAVLGAAWCALAVVAFAIGMFGKDVTGRHGGKPIGPTIAGKTAWFFMEIPALVAMPIVYAVGGERSTFGDLLVGAWLLHYGHRTLVWPWFVQHRESTLPLTTAAGGFFFNVINGVLLGWSLSGDGVFPAGWVSDPRFIAGALLFVGGATLNIASDYQLLDLRRKSTARYVMPNGGCFRFVSAPNLAGEMLEWLGFALMAWTLPGFAFALWSAANLIPRALWRHRWYRTNFDNYPRRRKAFFPGVL